MIDKVFKLIFSKGMDIHINFRCQIPLKKIIHDDIKTNGLKRIWKNAYAFIYMRFRFPSFFLLTQKLCLRNLQNALFCSLELYFCFQSPYFKLYFYFFNGQYATVCIFHQLKPRETYACEETRDLISFKKGVLVAEAQM